MWDKFQNIFRIQELRHRILFTLAMFLVFRVGSFIPIPGVDVGALARTPIFQTGAFGLMNIFAGGALQRMSIFALGIMPYISASIIMQLLTVAIPRLEQLSRQGARRIVGRKVYGGQSTYLPIRIGGVGVIAIIFAISVLLLPSTLARFIPHPITQEIAGWLSPGALLYYVLYALAVIFFTFFYTAVVFNPVPCFCLSQP